MKFQYNDRQKEPFQFQFSDEELGILRYQLAKAAEKFQADVRFFESMSKQEPTDDYAQKHAVSQRRDLIECEKIVNDFETLIMNFARGKNS